jgi:hypothetical protein
MSSAGASVYTKEVVIGAIALAGIGFHLMLRFGIGRPARSSVFRRK